MEKKLVLEKILIPPDSVFVDHRNLHNASAE